MPFSGWTRLLTPPRIVCPYTGEPTFRVAATDDGRIAAAGRIERCAVTGRRMLVTELVTCSATGRRVAPDLVEICPVSGRRLLRSELAECQSCRQRRQSGGGRAGRVSGLPQAAARRKADPRMARVLHEHPPLDRWRNWRIAETTRVYILVAAGWMRRLLVVVDKETLELKQVATGGRWTTTGSRSSRPDIRTCCNNRPNGLAGQGKPRHRLAGIIRRC